MALRLPQLCLALALGVAAMPHARAQVQSTGYAIPSDGTLLSVAADAESRRVPDVATISAGVVT